MLSQWFKLALAGAVAGTGWKELPAKPTGEVQKPSDLIYRFDHRANQLLRAAFPRHIMPSMVLKPYAWRDTGVAVEDLNDVLQLYLEAEYPTQMKLSPVDIGQDHMESYWLSIYSSNDRWRDLLTSKESNLIRDLAAALAQSDLVFTSPLEKALFQRDVFQMFFFVYRATNLAQGTPLEKHGRRMLVPLAHLWKRLRLSDAEFSRVRNQLPREIDERRFVTSNRFDLRDDYLPKRVIGDEDGWYKFPVAQEATQHFRAYGGRSFMHIYMKAPGMTDKQIREYWQETYGAHGAHHNVAYWLDPLPGKTETMAVRTFGVFLEDGSYADSGFPEEVIMRLFNSTAQSCFPLCA